MYNCQLHGFYTATTGSNNCPRCEVVNSWAPYTPPKLPTEENKSTNTFLLQEINNKLTEVLRLLKDKS